MSATFGLGLAALGRPGYMTLGHREDVPDASESAMRARAFEVLDEAWALGVRHVDTARSYGKGEQFLSEWIAQRRPAGLTVSSKWGYRYTAGWQRDAAVHEVKDHSLAHFEAQLAESRGLLGEHLAVYQAHSVTLESPLLADRSLQQRLARLRDEGVAIGASVSGPRQSEVIDRLLELSADGRRLLEWIQATWNVLERSAGPALQRAHDAGVRVIVKEGLANGRLTRRGVERGLLHAASSLDAAPDALALAIALAQPFATVVLSGATDVSQLRSNVGALTLRVSGAALSELTEPPETYWGTRSRLAWT